LSGRFGYKTLESATNGSQVIHNFCVDQLAGENFVAWTKGNRNSPRAGLRKKIHFSKTSCKTGSLWRRVTQLFRVASSLLTARVPIMKNAQAGA
jgi:hypothetical protein